MKKDNVYYNKMGKFIRCWYLTPEARRFIEKVTGLN